MPSKINGPDDISSRISARDAARLLRKYRFVPEDQNNATYWKHETYPAIHLRIRRSGVLDNDSTSRLRDSLRLVDQENAKTQVSAPADRELPCASATLPKGSDDVISGDAAALTEKSAALNQMIADAKKEYHMRFVEKGGTVRILQPDLGINVPPLVKADPDFLHHFREALTNAIKMAADTTEHRFSLLVALDDIRIGGAKITPELVEIDDPAKASSIITLAPDMKIPYYGAHVIPEQTAAALIRRIRIQNFNDGKGVNAHLRIIGPSGNFTSRMDRDETRGSGQAL